ncbi:MAG TPA: transglutaminase-like domain-containing protein [Candidatus Binataceae bacterium]|nr:transglutaminase-like domain-containing protein [Candidatus Binataceae bacterium]
MASRYGKSLFTVIALVLIPQVGSVCANDESAPRSRERHVRFSYVTEIGPIDPNAQSLKIWIPLPREDAFQHVTGISVESALSSRIVDQKNDGNRLVFIEAKGQLPQTIVVKLSADVVRRQESADLRKAAAGRTEPIDGGSAEFLRPDALVPTTGRIAQVSAQLDDGSATPFEQARIIYEYVTSVMRYDKTGTGWGRGDAIYACDVRRGNCTDFHSLFIALARSRGIPARFTIGFPLGTDRADKIPGYHCWAEFYAGGEWIPVDASEAWKHPARHDYYFGNLDADRIAFTRGRDLVLNPAQAGEPLNYLIYPYVQIDGKAVSKDQIKNSFAYSDLTH